jgi:hypothetical protein
MDALHYRDFDLDIDPAAGRRYPVRVLSSPAGQARGTLAFPFDAAELKERLAALEEAATGFADADAARQVQDFGAALFDALFAGDIHLAYQRSRQATETLGQGLRVRLRINAPELAVLPWEFLFDPTVDDFLALSRATALVRYLEAPIGDRDQTIAPPIRILSMVVSPSDLPRLDVAGEQARLEEAGAPLRQAGQVELVWLAGQTASALQAALQAGPWHAFHFVGHAAFDQTSGEGTVLLADERGRATPLSAVQLSRLLADHRALQLVVLNACEGARGSEHSLFSSTAAGLVRHGLPAVLAMQYAISDRAAVEFTRGFYGALANGLPIEAAVAEARKALSLALPDSPAWGTPVLHMRMASGQLFAAQPMKRRDFYETQFPLPDNYVPRPELLAGVRAALLDGAQNLALTSSLTVRTKADALHGMGGIGKSVAARALCDDLAVQAAFPDGILWATLGQTPDLLARLREWIDVLGGIVSENAPTVERMTAILADLLKERACLLVVDDVWKKAHVEPFRAGGPRCRLLLTTRDAALAEEIGADVHPVPVMAPAEAVALLEQWAGAELRDAAEIVRRLGYLPLAIRLAGAQLRRKEPAAWLAGFDAAKLAARRVETVHDSLKATFDLSLDALSDEDRRLYVALAIFKEDEPAPAAAIARLWSELDGRDEEGAAELLEDLAARALVQGGAEDGGAVTVHDLLRDFMEAELGDQGRLAAHRALLDAYRRTQQGQGCATAPDDGYFCDHLTFHLDAVADHDPVALDDLRSLFADQSWMNVRVPQSRYLYDGYLADLDVVWRRAHAEAHRQIDAGEEPVAIGDCVRYALIRTSINSLAANYVPELVARAVETGLWPAERALSVTIRVPDPKSRAKLWTAILRVGTLTDRERQQAAELALATALAISDGRSRVGALTALAPQLTGEARDRALEQRLTAALAIGDEEYRAFTLMALAPQLTGEARDRALEQGLASAQAIYFEGFKVHALATLASHLMGEARDRVLEQGTAAAAAIFNEESRAIALTTLAPQLTGPLLEQGLVAALAIGDERFRAQALTGLAPHLTGVDRNRALEQGLAAALAIDNEGYRAEALAGLAPQLSGALFEQGLTAAEAIRDELCRAQALTALASRLAGEARDRALEQGLAAAITIDNEDRRAQALAALAPQLTGALLEQGLAVALAIDNERIRAHVLAGLAPRLTGALFEQGLTAAKAIRDELCRAQALTALASRLTGEARDQALEEGLAAALAIGDEWLRAYVLADLAAQLTGEAWDRALEQRLAYALNIREERPRAIALTDLARQLTGDARDRALEQGLTAALAIHDQRYQADALTALAPQLTGSLLEQGLAVALTIHDDLFQADALAALAPQLTGALLEQGLVAALAIDNEGYRAEALAGLAPQLSGALLEQGLTAAVAIRDESCRAHSLAALAPLLTGALLEHGLVAVLAIGDEDWRAQVLLALAPQLTGALLEQGLAVALTIDNERIRAHALADLAPHLAGEDRDLALEQGLAAAVAIRDELYRAQALTALAPQLAEEARDQALEEVLAAALAIGYERSQADALADLAPHLTGVLLIQGLAAALAIGDEKSQVDALVALAPHLAGEDRDLALEQGLAAALAIGDEKSRVDALVALAPHLAGEDRDLALERGLAAAMAIGDERSQALTLVALAPELEGTLLEQGLASALAIHDESCRAWALANLTPQLTGEERGQALMQGLSAALAIGNERFRAHVLGALAPQLSGALLEQGLAAAFAIGDEPLRRKVLAAMTPQLTGVLLEQGLTAVLTTGDERSRAGALADFFSAVSDKRVLLTRVRVATVDLLHKNLAHTNRAPVLEFCSARNLFSPSVMGPNILAAITSHIIEICQHWVWL